MKTVETAFGQPRLAFDLFANNCKQKAVIAFVKSNAL